MNLIIFYSNWIFQNLFFLNYFLYLSFQKTISTSFFFFGFLDYFIYQSYRILFYPNLLLFIGFSPFIIVSWFKFFVLSHHHHPTHSETHASFYISIYSICSISSRNFGFTNHWSLLLFPVFLVFKLLKIYIYISGGGQIIFNPIILFYISFPDYS